MDVTTIPQVPASATPQAVEEQLQRLLASPLFSHSRRYPGFLSYVVGEALKGNQDHLKERSIGIDVFHRVPDYDLNVDPIVRVTAGEVRKRLAQYYYSPEHQDEVRIELKPGSYIPGFKLPPERRESPRDSPVEALKPAVFEVAEHAPPALEPPFAPPFPEHHRTSWIHGRLAAAQAFFRRPRWIAISLVVAMSAALAGTGAAIYGARTGSALDAFWQPIWKNSAPVLISVGSWQTPSSVAGDVSIGTHAKSSDPIALADTVTIVSMQQLLSQHGKASQIQSSAQTTFADLQRGTTILISGFDNPWTMRLTDPLRFHFVARTPDVLMIEDRNNPGRSDWLIDTRSSYAKLTRDFGIVARFHDPTTEQTIVVAAGIGENGTLAAGKMLASEELLQTAVKGAGITRRYNNIEAVIETLVIDGKSGPPRIVSLTTW